MDVYTAAVNPCSVESLSLSNGIWPVVVSCYQLKEDGSRRGHQDLLLVGRDLKFEQPHTIHTDDSGILDGKWRSPVNGSPLWFATARSTGQVRIDSFSFADSKESLTKVEHVASSELLQETPALCLSLNWSMEKDASATQIVSSYSNGKVAIHDVVTQGDETVQVVERTSWVAHSFFGNTPTEVWSACFASFDNVVFSGGDDAKLKLWDVRSTTRPMQVLQHFEAGVTCISTNPKNCNICAVGSYDETLALYDVRKTSCPLLHSKPLGGGIWRIKWHPRDRDRVLLAAMHGGCCVVEFQGEKEFVVTKEFTKHESMAYGADWIVSHGEDNEDFVEAAASCSFYDRAVYLWDTR